MLFNAKKAIFFGAHTDDEFIAAGTLHRLSCEGCEVHVVTYAPAAIESDRKGTKASSAVVEPEWHRALDAIGVGEHNRQFLDLTPSSQLDHYRQNVCQFCYDYVELKKPDVCFILSPDDENTAHSLVGIECERVMRGRVPTVIRCQFPWNYSHGRGNLFVRLSEENCVAKQAVIRCYKSQEFRYSYERMLVSYAFADGLSVKSNDPCEKFELLRSVL